jgi:hypothetical protein
MKDVVVLNANVARARALLLQILYLSVPTYDVLYGSGPTRVVLQGLRAHPPRLLREAAKPPSRDESPIRADPPGALRGPLRGALREAGGCEGNE